MPGTDDGVTGPTIVRSSGSWASDNFAKDKTIQVTGTPSGKNDGTYDVADISSDGKSLILVTSDAVRSQTISTGTSVTIREVNTDLAPENVQFVAVDSKGNAISGSQKQSDISKNAAPPANYNPAFDFLSGFPLPLQVSLTQSYAKTTIADNAQLEATGNITISSKAIGKSETSLPSLVFGLTWVDSDVQAITKIGNAKITAGGSFSATSELENELSASVKTFGGSIQNPTAGDAVQIPGPSIAVGVARGTSISRAETSDGTIINAGDVTIESSMTNSFSAESSAGTSNAKSFAGSIGVTVADHSEEAKAILRGTIVSGGDVSVSATGENEAIETRTEASVNTDDPEEGVGPNLSAFNSIVGFLKSAKDKQDSKSKNEQSKEGESGTTLQIAGAVTIAFFAIKQRKPLLATTRP